MEGTQDDLARRVRAQRLLVTDFAPFGWLPVADTDTTDGSQRLRFEWDDAHVNVISHRAEEITRHDEVLRCTEMFHHQSHTQVLMVLDVPAVIAVAPPELRFEGAADAAGIRAFLLDPLDAFVLHQGTWHWGPFPLGERPVTLFNVQGLRYAEDNGRIDLEAIGAAVDVLVS